MLTKLRLYYYFIFVSITNIIWEVYQVLTYLQYKRTHVNLPTVTSMSRIFLKVRVETPWIMCISITMDIFIHKQSNMFLIWTLILEKTNNTKLFRQRTFTPTKSVKLKHSRSMHSISYNVELSFIAVSQSILIVRGDYWVGGWHAISTIHCRGPYFCTFADTKMAHSLMWSQGHIRKRRASYLSTHMADLDHTVRVHVYHCSKYVSQWHTNHFVLRLYENAVTLLYWFT